MKSRLRTLPLATVLLYSATALLFAAYFSPQRLPFMHIAPSQRIIMASAVPQHTTPQTPKIVISGKPVRIWIPTVSVDITVADGIYDQRRHSWSLSTSQAHYALITPQPNNQQGNTFIYGHNRRGVFAGLLHLKLGDKAYVETDNGKVFTYTLRMVKDVTSDNTDDIFTYAGSPTLTVQTCAGTWYEDRRLFTFDFVRVTDRSNG